MLRYTQSPALVLFAVLVSCGSDRGDRDEKLDLVGNHPPEKSVVKPETEKVPPEEMHGDLFVVDLIQDQLFRLERDGWTLTSAKSHTSLDRLKAGGVDLVLSAVPLRPGKPASQVMEEGIASLEKLVADAGGKARLVTSISDARKASAKGVIAFGIMLEGGDGLDEKTFDDLYDLKKRGLMMIGLVGPHGNRFGDSSVAPSSEGGLSKRGAELISHCRDLGLAVDLTHASQATFWDALVGQGSLVAVSHTAARALREHPRNLTDLQILALSRHGGVMGLVFNTDLIKAGEKRAAIEDITAQVVHVKKIGSIGCLALGSDFGGIKPPSDMQDVSKLRSLTGALLAAGLDESEVRGVMGGNAERFLLAVEGRQGAAESGRAEPLRPIPVECDSVTGESDGAFNLSCDGYLDRDGLKLGAASRQRFRLQNMGMEPTRVEIFGEPGTPWQVEAQNLEGKVLIRRGVALDENGVGSLPLPARRGLVRVFLAPTRPSTLREAVVWGR